MPQSLGITRPLVSATAREIRRARLCPVQAVIPYPFTSVQAKFNILSTRERPLVQEAHFGCHVVPHQLAALSLPLASATANTRSVARLSLSARQNSAWRDLAKVLVSLLHPEVRTDATEEIQRALKPTGGRHQTAVGKEETRNRTTIQHSSLARHAG